MHIIKEQLLSEMSKRNIHLVSQAVSQRPEFVKDLWDIIIEDIDPDCRRAAWAWEHLAMEFADIRQQYVPQMIELLLNTKRSAIQRHMSKLLCYSIIQEDDLGALIDFSFQRIDDAETPVAVKVHCMQLIFNSTKQFPELKEELRAVIENEMQHCSAGFKSRGRKILAKL